jgi:hypothetical protein
MTRKELEAMAEKTAKEEARAIYMDEIHADCYEQGYIAGALAMRDACADVVRNRTTMISVERDSIKNEIMKLGEATEDVAE